MTETETRDTSATRTSVGTTERYSAWAVGWITFAAVMMIMIGSFQALAGIVAIADDEFYAGVREYTFKFDTTQWGWIHLVFGILIVVAGIGLFSGNVLARIVAVALAGLSAIANFMWLPYYPVWSIVVIALNVAVIWALTAHGRDIRLNE